MKRNIQVGTRVVVHRDNGQDFETVTRSEVQQLPSGAWVVWVKGIAGCYSVDRVDVLDGVS